MSATILSDAPKVEVKTPCPRYKAHETPSPGSEVQKAIRDRLRLLKAHAMAAAHGGACLSAAAAAHTSFLEWGCARQHTWKNTYCMIVCENFWCPNCPEDDRKDLKVVLETYKAKLYAALEAGKLRA